MNGHWIYVTTNPGSAGITHMAPFDADEATLCGRPTANMEFGDETVSGVACGCLNCLRIAGRSDLAATIRAERAAR